MSYNAFSNYFLKTISGQCFNHLVGSLVIANCLVFNNKGEIMADQHKVAYHIKPQWKTINDIKNNIKYVLRDKDKDLVYDAQMVASELCENAIKYGENGDLDDILIELFYSDKLIEIKVINNLYSSENLNEVAKCLEKIKKSNDLEALYTQRLFELMNKTKIDRSQLGFYRIAYESQFSLTWKYREGVLTIIAVRQL